MSEATLQHAHSKVMVDTDSTSSEPVPTQAGVKNVEAIKTAFGKVDFWVMYIGLLLVAYISSLDGQSFWTLEPFITSSFSAHSMLTVLPIINQIINAVSKFPIVKLADTFGRMEAYIFSLVCYIVGYITMCLVTNYSGFAGASVLYSIGTSGIYMMQQLIIADTTTLANRGFLSSLPDFPFIINAWVGPIYAVAFLPDNWRWTMGIMIILMPVVSIMVIGGLWHAEHKAKKVGKVRPAIRWNKNFLMELVMGMDLVGVLLLAGAWSLILFPLLRATSYDDGWRSGSVIAMIVSGVVLHILLIFWEKYFATYPIVPIRMIQNRTVLGGLLSVFFIFMSWFLYNSYLTSYLYLTRGIDFDKAQWITNGWMFASVGSSILLGLVMKFHKRYLIWAFIGLAINMIGNGLMVNFRGPENAAVEIVFSQILAGLGAGMITCATQVGAQAAVPHQDVGIVTGIYLSIAAIGGAIGSAIAGSMWTNMMPNQLTSHGVPADALSEILGDVTFARESLAEYPGISDAYTYVTKRINIVSLCVLIPIFGCLLAMKNLRLPDDKVAAGAPSTAKDANGEDEIRV
ncbi:hypothetical protein SpCBS45565_g01825 [Spizellomyces sp. 'palustris']|nr:hypothetical protein SpCBS45565_g01825 [Spizellomyces sp. 'palustris']